MNKTRLGLKGLIYNGRVQSLGNDDKIVGGATGYRFLSGVVVEVFEDPIPDLNEKINIDGNEITMQNFLTDKVLHPERLSMMPKNSIIAHILDDGSAISGQLPVICFPFFGSALSLPITPGEHVWILEESFLGRYIYHWMSRKVSIGPIEDLNYTNSSRIEAVENAISEYGNNKKFDEDNIVSSFYDYNEYDSLENLPGTLNEFLINQESNSFRKYFTREPVPSAKKRSSDVMIQGSNNSIVHMTTEKFTSPEKCQELYSKNMFSTNSSNIINENRTPLSPAIDICIARKKSELVSIGENQNTQTQNIIEANSVSVIKNSIGFLEVDKNQNFRKNFSDFKNDAIDNSPTDCGARIYMSNNCTIDEIFNINITDFENRHGSCLATFTENNRMFSTNSILIANNFSDDDASYISIDNAGTIQLGSKNANKASEGSTTGLQPFVRGDDLETILTNILTELNSVLTTIGTAMQNSVSPFFSIPIPALTANASSVLTSAGNISGYIEDLPNFKSQLIKGE